MYMAARSGASNAPLNVTPELEQVVWKWNRKQTNLGECGKLIYGVMYIVQNRPTLPQ